MWRVACGMWFAHVIQLQRRVSCAACPCVSLPACLSLSSSVLSSLLLWYLFYLHFFMAFCRASGHVLVITICHWFPVNADESRDGSIRLSLSLLPCWVVCTLHSALFPCSTLPALSCPAQSLCVLVLLSCYSPSLALAFLFLSLVCFLVLVLVLVLVVVASSSAFGPWYIIACRLSCLFALFSKTWQQQLAQLPAP